MRLPCRPLLPCGLIEGAGSLELVGLELVGLELVGLELVTDCGPGSARRQTLLIQFLVACNPTVSG